MNELASAIEEVRAELAGAANDILFDLCDIYAPLFTDGGSAGDSVGLNPTPVATNVNVTYKGFGATRQFIAGGEAYTADSQLKMVRNAQTVAITPRHRLHLKVRGLTGALIFEKPHVTEDSISPLLKVNATLVVQGYQ